ncbi:ARID1_AT-rich interaction domain protein [Hexamita inflata]|uniref:ARID1 AT-rich interaction domain protein n=1 Tax=Hexamita inflata TaxID=28002 RepID=A0AA86REE0_9EUKA|nr:ARID1 AT-rich interaction domain protein [Hexamita inflata]
MTESQCISPINTLIRNYVLVDSPVQNYYPESIDGSIKTVFESSSQNLQIMQTYDYKTTKDSTQRKRFENYVYELRRTIFCRQDKIQRVGGKDLDLYHLYQLVQSAGGYLQISSWKALAAHLNLPSSVTNAGYLIRSKYESFILPFETKLILLFPVYNFNLNPTTQTQPNIQNITKQYLYTPLQVNKCTKLVLNDLNPTDSQFQCVLDQNVNLVYLQIGALTKISKVPHPFPKYLRKIVLKNVPQKMVQELIDEFQFLDFLEELEINGE